MKELIDILEQEGEKLSNRAIVLQLCAENVSDYQRGRIQGQIEMLTQVMRRLVEKDTGESDEDS